MSLSPIRTPLCDLLGIEVPIIGAPLGGPWDQSMELVSAISEAGGLGSIATTFRSPEQVRQDIARVRDLTDRPFAVNMTRRPFDPDVLAAVLADPPPVFSLALGAPLDVVDQVHRAGSLFLQQVMTVNQAVKSAAAGADVISAQGSESGGFSGQVSTMALVPQVVDAVDVPVVASGGIADGRGLAAALALGAQGVNIGTRFLASAEAAIPDSWKEAICAAQSEDAVKLLFADHALPAPTEGGYDSVPRALRTSFVESWNARVPLGSEAAAELREGIQQAIRDHTSHELLPLTGQTAGLIRDVEPAAVIVRRIADDAASTLTSAGHWLTAKA
jgi:enoyl-[acyl-carrier protein] reductase II